MHCANKFFRQLNYASDGPVPTRTKRSAWIQEFGKCWTRHHESALRWKWLALFGSLVGLCMGYLYYRRQVPTYHSVALVQVVYPASTSAGLDTMDPDGIRGQSRLDESLIIKSSRVVDLAIDIGKLGEQAYLADKSPEEIRSWILANESSDS